MYTCIYNWVSIMYSRKKFTGEINKKKKKERSHCRYFHLPPSIPLSPEVATLLYLEFIILYFYSSAFVS